ncbi:MAG: SHD1 domain-containing protein [Planctomycetota bacterium]
MLQDFRCRLGSRTTIWFVYVVVLFALVKTPFALAQELYEAPESLKQYRLSNLQVKQRGISKVISFDYEKIKDGEGSPRLRVRSDAGRVGLRGLSIRIGDSGTIDLEYQRYLPRALAGDDGLEFYFVADDSRYPSLSAIHFSRNSREFLISNAVQFGSMSTQIKPRKISKEEKERIAEAKRRRLPPEDVPDGYTRYSADPPLVAGVPILGGRSAEWKDAVVVRISGQYVYVSFKDNKRIGILKHDYIAVSDADMKRLKDDPGSYKPTVRTLPGSLLVLPENWLIASTQMPLPAGVPLKMEDRSEFKSVRFVGLDKEGAQVISETSMNPKVETVPVKSLAIESSVAAKLEDPEVQQAFKQKLKELIELTKKIPMGSSSMDSGFAMPSFGDSSTDASIASQSTANTEGARGAGKVDQIPVAQKGQPEVAERTWKDASGRFELQATFLESDDVQVRLKRPDGRIIEVPIKKLSEADQLWLREYKTQQENPFNNVVDLAADASYESPSESTELMASSQGGSGVRYGGQWKPWASISGLRSRPKSLAISPNGKFLLVGGSSRSAYLYSLPSGQLLIDSEDMDDLGNVTACAFSPDGSMAFLGGYRGVIDVYEVAASGRMTSKLRLATHQREISSLAVSSNNLELLSGSEDQTAILWDLKTGDIKARITDFKGAVKATCIPPGGERCFATDGALLKVIDTKTGNVIRTTEPGRSPHSGQASAFSPNGQRLALGDGYDFKLYDLRTMTEQRGIEGTEISWKAVFAPDNRHLIAGGNGLFNVYDTNTSFRVQSEKIGEHFYVQALATNPQGNLIAAQSGYKDVIVFKAQP